MGRLEIIKAGTVHIDGIVEIENLSFSIPWTRQSIIDEITGNGISFYICALIDGKVCGYAGMWHICDEGHITNIAVHPEFRKSGVGSALLEGLLLHARNSAIRSLTLEVRKSNIAAQMLYRKYSFTERGFRKAYYADNNEDALIMWMDME